ncbi:hypothetical protein GQ53DRAFT_648927 [Thozetella sp. PMI_491]|nr:hypothetical protein GQ53DRAFT_648927 [Thozetella sp. PMI_491]
MPPLRLEELDSTVLPRLGRVLWSWDPCSDCLRGKLCASGSCPGHRISRLQRYFQFYKAVVAAYVEESPKSPRALETHEDLCQAITVLKNQPDITKLEFLKQGFSTTQDYENDDLLHATALSVRVLIMVEPLAFHHSSARLEKGGFKITWKEDIAFSKFLQDAFPLGNHPVLSYMANDHFLDMKAELRASKLIKHLGIAFRATHNIRSHLIYDRRENVVEIYHHAAFLKEQLRVTKGPGDFSTPFNSLKTGSLPRQLVLETLDSVQDILFPLSEPKSKRLLKSLVFSCSMDPDVSNFEFSSIRNSGEEKIRYVYLADRLSDLYNELQNPRPRGWLERQMERKSGARYILMATLIGVVFAVVLGMLSLAVTSYQTWISYQAWQHPVALPST